jgi:hypothetical protein
MDNHIFFRDKNGALCAIPEADHLGVCEERDNALSRVRHLECERFVLKARIAELSKPEITDGPGVWRRANGQLVPIKDMGDTHLLNAYRKRERDGFISGRDFANLLDSQVSSDYSLWASRVSQAKLCPRMNLLVDEIKRRGLEDQL